MTTQHFEAGDTLVLPNGETTIDSMDGRTVELNNGSTFRTSEVKQGLAAGHLDIIPAGTGDRDVYVRFGDIPEGEQSTNHTAGTKEAGVSVYACESDTPDDEAETDADEAYYLCGTQLQTVFGLLDRPIYLVSGERVGTGADGEPVIRDIEIEADLTTPAGCGGFVEV